MKLTKVKDKLSSKVSLEVFFLLLIIFIGAVLRFTNLGVKSFWFDEAMLWYESMHPFPIMIKMMNMWDSFPFLFVVLVKFIGFVSMAESVLRIIPFLFGVGSIILMYFLCKEFLKTIPSLVGALLVSLSSLQLIQSQELRPYALLMFLTLALLFTFIKYIKHRKNIYLAIFLAIGIISIFSHYALCLFLFVLNLIIGIQIIKGEFNKEDILKWFIVQNILIFSLILIWNINFKSQLEMQRRNPASHAHINSGFPDSRNPKTISKFLVNNTKKIFFSFYGRNDFDFSILWLLFGFGILRVYRDRQKRLFFYIFSLLICINIFLAISKIYPYFWGKYAIYLSPFYYFFIAAAFNTNYIKKKIILKIFSIFVIVYLVNSGLNTCFQQLFSPGTQEAREVVAYLNNYIKEDEKVYVNQGGFYAFAYYYKREPHKIRIGMFWGGIENIPFHKIVYLEMQKVFEQDKRGWVFLSLFDEVHDFKKILSQDWKIERWITNQRGDVNLLYIYRK